MGVVIVSAPQQRIARLEGILENMPTALQWLAQAVPLTHFLVIVEGSFLKAMPAADVLTNAWPLAVIALATLTMATVFVRGRLQ